MKLGSNRAPHNSSMRDVHVTNWAIWGLFLSKILTFLLGKKKDFAALNTKFVRMKAHLPLIYWLWAETQPWLFQQKVNHFTNWLAKLPFTCWSPSWTQYCVASVTNNQFIQRLQSCLENWHWFEKIWNFWSYTFRIREFLTCILL